MAAMLEFRTQGYNPYAVKYSPYYDSRIAVATSANFGIVGNGRVFALGLTAQGVQVEKTYATAAAAAAASPSLSLPSSLRHNGRLIFCAPLVDSTRTMRCTTWPGRRSMRTS